MAQPSLNLKALSPLIDVLIDAEEPSLRDRILLEAVLATHQVESAALWRPVTDPTRAEGAARQWTEVLARGPADRLPSAAQVAAVAAGELDEELPDRREVRVVEEGGRAWALGLGGVRGPEAGDLFEALLLTSLLADAAGEVRGKSTRPTPAVDLLETLTPALPANPYLNHGGDPHLRHDLRNLLTSIRATRDLLGQFRDELSDDEAVHFQEVLEREYLRAGDLLLGAICGPEETPEDPDEPTTVQLGAAVREAVETEAPAMLGDGISVEVRVPTECEELRCPLDALSFSRVLANLLTNAREALLGDADTVGRPLIRIEAERSGSELELRVVDNGPGVPAGDRERVFVEGYTAGKPGGSGCGLAAVRKLVREAGGRVDCVEAPAGSRGAVFRMVLPVLETDSQAVRRDS